MLKPFWAWEYKLSYHT